MLELRFCSEFGYWHLNLVDCNEPCIIGSSGSIVFIMRIFALYSGGNVWSISLLVKIFSRMNLDYCF